MVGDLPEETSPQRALELVIAELTTLQPWFLELIFEDHLFREAYEAARAYAGSPRDALGQPNPEVIEALGISQYLANLPNTVPAGSVLVHNHVRKRSEEHTSELQSRGHLVCRLLLEKKKR